MLGGTTPETRMRTKTLARLAIAGLCASVLLAACGTTGVSRRVSEPAASIQQLTVQADGSWSLDVRLNNYSAVAMRFHNLDLALQVDGQPAGALQASPGIAIGPESADIASVALAPQPQARMVMADALARGRAVRYELKGSIGAGPEGGNPRVWQVERSSTLNPVPGLPGVLR